MANYFGFELKVGGTLYAFDKDTGQCVKSHPFTMTLQEANMETFDHIPAALQAQIDAFKQEWVLPTLIDADANPLGEDTASQSDTTTE